MKVYEHNREFNVKYCDVDFKDELKPSAILAYVEEAASSSADELGFGRAFIQPRGYAFVVSNVCCEFYQPIPLGATVRVKTWPLPPSHVIFGREYRLTDEQDVVYANASSRWCLIDRNAGKILPSKVIENQDYSTYNTTKVIENVHWKIPAFSVEEGELRYTLTVAYSDYDHNMHVNNTKYADYCFNCFSLAELTAKKLKGLSISYLKQCKEGDVLRFYRKSDEANTYLIQGVNARGEIVTQARITFED